MPKAGNARAAGALKWNRIGVIGDVHTERKLLAHVLEQLAQMELDGILCTGDMVDGPNDAGEAAACCELLERFSVVTVCGNHDRWLQDGEMRDLPGATDPEEAAPKMLQFLSGLPQTVEIETPLGKALLCHGMGSDDMAAVQPFDHGLALDGNDALQELLREKKYHFVISGHTHRPMVRVIDSLTVINAGTLHNKQNPCWSVIDFRARHIQFYDIAEDGSSSPSAEWSL